MLDAVRQRRVRITRIGLTNEGRAIANFVRRPPLMVHGFRRCAPQVISPLDLPSVFGHNPGKQMGDIKLVAV